MASVRKRVSKGGETTYAVLFRMGGKQKSRTFEPTPGRKPDKAATDFATLIDLLGAEKALATLAADESDGLSVNDLFEQWIAWKATTKVTARTLRDYRRDYLNSIHTPLGGRSAETVDELDVQAWVDKIGARLDPKTVADRHMILSSIFKFGSARSRRLVSHNPCLETQLPSKKKKAPKGFTLAEWDAMHAWASEHNPDADDLLLFIADTGWRFSEASALAALGVEDYGDTEHEGIPVPIVFVTVLGVHRLDEKDRVVYVEGEGKSQAAIRRINLPPESAQMIRRRMVGKGLNDLIFTNPRGNQWRSSTFIAREFDPILKAVGIAKVRGMGPHYLRHHHVGVLDRAGVGLVKTQRRIGHENISTTVGQYGGMIDNALSPAELLAIDAQRRRPAALGTVVTGSVVEPAADVLPLSSPQVVESDANDVEADS